MKFKAKFTALDGSGKRIKFTENFETDTIVEDKYVKIDGFDDELKISIEEQCDTFVQELDKKYIIDKRDVYIIYNWYITWYEGKVTVKIKKKSEIEKILEVLKGKISNKVATDLFHCYMFNIDTFKSMNQSIVTKAKILLAMYNTALEASINALKSLNIPREDENKVGPIIDSNKDSLLD